MPTSQAVQDVKKYIPQLNATHDELLGLIEARARAIIDSYYRLHLGPGWPGFVDWAGDSANIVYGWGDPLLWLPPHQIGSVTSINFTSLVGDNYVLGASVPSRWYEDQLTGGLIYPGSTWGTYAYSVVAIWGYGPMPDYVYQVLLELMINIWRGKDRAQTQEGIPLTFNAKLTEDQERTLSAVLMPWQAKVGTIKVYRETG